MNISKEAIEAAAEALFNRGGHAGAFDEHPVRMMYVNQSRAALEAAAPLLMAQAWDEGTRAQAEWHHAERRAASRFQATPPVLMNPYRKETP